MQFLICTAFAKEEPQLVVDKKKERMKEPIIEKKDYDVSETVKKGKEVILEQKRKLQEKKKPKEEIEEKVKEEEEEARREIYEQKIIQEAAGPQPITTLERQLQREKFRRELMTAAGKEIAPPFKMRKRFNLRVSETYDDNIYLTKTNKEEDYITKISPSVLFSLSSKYIVLDTNYVMDITQYKNRKDQGGISHLLSTYIKPGTLPFFKRRGKIGIEVQDDFQPLVTSVATTEQTQRTDRTHNKLFLAVDYYMSQKRTLALEYTNIYEHYRDTSLQSCSYTENIISPMFYFHIRPNKWSLFTGYDYGVVDYSRGTNGSTYQRLKAGLTGRIFAKVLTHFEAGKEWREYKESKNGEVQKVFFKTALLDKFTPSTTGSLQYTHTLNESTYTNNPYFVSDDIDLNLEHKFTYKTTGTFGLGYTLSSYDRSTTEDGVTKKREDTIWQPRLGLRYYFKKWLSAGLDYFYKKRTSNFGKFDYVDNRIIGGVNMVF